MGGSSNGKFRMYRNMGIAARKAGFPIARCPLHLSKTQQAFWRIGWESADDNPGEVPLEMGGFTIVELRHILTYTRSGKNNGCTACEQITRKIEKFMGTKI